MQFPKERVSYYKYMYIHILYVVGRMWWFDKSSQHFHMNGWYNVDYYKPALWGKTIEAWGDVACLRPFLMLLFLCWPSCYFWIRMCTPMLLLNDDGIASSLYSAALYLIQNTVVSILNLWRSLRFSFLKSCLPS